MDAQSSSYLKRAAKRKQDWILNANVHCARRREYDAAVLIDGRQVALSIGTVVEVGLAETAKWQVSYTNDLDPGLPPNTSLPLVAVETKRDKRVA